MNQFISKLIKRLLVLGFTGVLLIWAGLEIFNLWVLPRLFEKFVRGEFSRKYAFEISCREISFGLWRGFVLREVQIEGKIKNDSIRLKAREVKIELKVALLFKRRWAIEHFNIIQGQGFLMKDGKAFPFSLGEVQGSLYRGSVGWRGGLQIEDLSLGRGDFLIKKMSVSIGRSKIGIRDTELFWHGHPFYLKSLVVPSQANLKIFCQLSGLDFHLMSSFEDDKLQFLGVGANQTEFLSVTDFREGLRESWTWFEGILGPVSLKDGVFGLSLERDKRFFLREFKVGTCEGTIAADAWARLGPSHSFGGGLNLEGIKLALLSPILFPKGEVLEGDLHGSVSFLGGERLEDFKAEGTLKVDEGHLWKVSLMKGVLKIFQPIFPGLGEVRFTSCTCRFFVDSGTAYIEELRLASSVVVMSAKGKMGLRGQDLDLRLTFSLKPTGLKDKTFLSKVITTGLMMTSQQVWQIRIKGTLKNPEITPLFFPILQPIKKIFETPFRQFKKALK